MDQKQRSNLVEKLKKAIDENGESLKRLIVKQLNKIMKEKGKKLSNKKILKELRKIPEISAALDNKPKRLILDEPIPEINVPILEPLKPQKSNKTFNWGNYSFKVLDKDEFSKKLAGLTNENIIKLTNKKQTKLKTRKKPIISDSVSDELAERKFNIEEKETALRGYLKTYRIDGQKGYGPNTFLNKIKPKVLDLINKQKKPIKVKFIFTCKFKKRILILEILMNHHPHFILKNRKL